VQGRGQPLANRVGRVRLQGRCLFSAIYDLERPLDEFRFYILWEILHEIFENLCAKLDAWVGGDKSELFGGQIDFGLSDQVRWIGWVCLLRWVCLLLSGFAGWDRIVCIRIFGREQSDGPGHSTDLLWVRDLLNQQRDEDQQEDQGDQSPWTAVALNRRFMDSALAVQGIPSFSTFRSHNKNPQVER